MKVFARWMLLMAGLAFLPVSCEKIELPSEEEVAEGEELAAGETPSDGGEAEVGGDPDGDGTLSVAQAQEAYGQFVGVRGYIVGYVSGTWLTAAVFGVPDGRANTNMLIADTPWETDVASCMPVFLDADDVRPALNLYDHPEYYGRLVYIEGYVETYFTVAGIREIYAYQLLEEDDEAELPGGIEQPVVRPDTQHVVSGRGVPGGN